MKKITTIATAFLLFAGVTMNAQTALKKGSVAYKIEMSGNNEANAMMGESTMTIHFDEKMQATEMNMMGGMMLMKTISPVGNLKDSKMAIEVIGMKYEITDIDEEALNSNKSVGDLENALEVSYDKKDTKEIAGFKCYKATVNMNDGTKSTYYITEAIVPQISATESKLKLAGYPLEITTQTAQGDMIMKATKFSKEVSPEAFKVGEGYTKTTMEEFQKQMGGM